MTAQPLHSTEQLRQRLLELDAFLLEHAALWRPRPFHHLQLPWESQHPQLARWLRTRNLEHAEQAQHDPAAVTGAPEPYPALARRSAALSQLGSLAGASNPAPRPERLGRDIPGRKLGQIRAFAAALDFSQPPAALLDWCAGKGHLGRWLAYPDTPLTCLEQDAALCQAGQALSRQFDLPARHLQQDVLADSCRTHLDADSCVVALHACGDLHVQLLRLASAAGCRQLALSPCCYNRIQASHYQPLSRLAAQSALQLSRDDLALPLCETVTAGARVRRQRDQSMAWRLGFDLLQREQRGSDGYLPTPPLESRWLNGSFADFCRHLAALKDLPLGTSHDWAGLERQGWRRLAEVRNLELVRNLFRRPLELWLLLDRALFLAEHGYRVRLGEFCPSALSPRNLLLLAERDPVDNSVEKI